MPSIAGIRAASPARLIAGIFSRAVVLVGSGIAAGNVVLLLLLFATVEPELELAEVANALLTTSSVMPTVGLLACVEPARRALRIDPIGALKEA